MAVIGIPGEMDHVRFPGENILDERWIAEPKKMIRAGTPGRVGRDFVFVIIGQRDIPRNGLFEARIKLSHFATVPGEKDFDLQSVALRQPPIKRDVILNRMRDDEGETEHGWISRTG